VNPYEILGLDPECNDKDIKIAFRNLSKKHHPDKGGDHALFVEINVAVQLLRDPYRRNLYDNFGICIEVSEEIVNTMVINKFRELINAWINMQRQHDQAIPIKDFFSANLAQALNEKERELSKAKNDISNLKIRRAQVTTTGKINIVHEVMDSHISGLKEAIERNEQEKYVISLIQKEAAQYSSEEIMEHVVMNRSTHTSTGSTMYFRSF